MGKRDGCESILVGFIVQNNWSDVEMLSSRVGFLRRCFSGWCNLRGEESTSEDRRGQDTR